MSTVIYKYQLYNHLSRHYIPRGAKFLCVQAQNGVPQMWFEVDLDAEEEHRYFVAFATGEKITTVAKRQYLGTFQLGPGSLVFHVFELLT